MINKVRVRAPNSLLFVMGSDAAESPETMGAGLIASTPSCIAVGTRAAPDGETLVILTDQRASVLEFDDLYEAFTGALATPEKVVHIFTSDIQSIAAQTVSQTESVVEIWVNDESEPDVICVLIRK